MISRASNAFAAGVFVMALAMGSFATAQEISADHLAAARKAITATKATEAFDNILLNAVASVKDQLINTSPDKSEEIDNIVNEEAIALAPRRGDLEAEAARLFANQFTVEELNEIAAFFSSPTGAKYLENTPILARELSKAARTWATGINRDLSDNVTKRMINEQ